MRPLIFVDIFCMKKYAMYVRESHPNQCISTDYIFQTKKFLIITANYVLELRERFKTKLM